MAKSEIAPVNWVRLFWISVFWGFVGGVLCGVMPFVLLFEIRILLYVLAVVIFCVSAVVGIFALKELIVEANVRALEVYHGKARKIMPSQNYVASDEYDDED